MTFEEWFDKYDIFEVEPYSNLNSQFEIEIHLKNAWMVGYAEGIIKGSEKGDYFEGWEEGYKAGKLSS